MNERYAQREVSGRSNRTIVAAVRTAHAVLMRGALRREIFAPMARTLFERCIASYIAHRISGAVQRHRITDAGMQLDRAGGGAASGEEERLPGRFSLFSFFYKRKREVTSIQKAVADRQLHGKTMRTVKCRGCEKENKQTK